MNQPIITSMLDFDRYKPGVHQVFFKRLTGITGRYAFTCRNKDKVDLLKYVPLDELEEQIFVHLALLRMTPEEKEWLKTQPGYDAAYIEFLYNFRFNPNHISIVLDQKNRTYEIEAGGDDVPLTSVALYETFVLQIVNELFERNYTAKNRKEEEVQAEGLAKLRTKISMLKTYNEQCVREGFKPVQMIEFGARRRYSKAWQETVLKTLLKELPETIIGTSNIDLARRLNIRAIGTFGHEFPMALQGIYPVQHSQSRALEMWLDEYKGSFGIALSDTLGNERFDKDFHLGFAKAYDGTRHDSGDPFDYGERMIAKYESMGIDPKTKVIVFSDGLDIHLVIALHRRFRGRIIIIFGVGTNLTNDVGNPVLQIVMKLVRCNGQDVCKLSANPAKACCQNPLYLEYAKMAVEKY